MQKYLGKGVKILKTAPELGLHALYKPPGSVSHRDTISGSASQIRCLIDAPYNMRNESFVTHDGSIHLLHRLDRETSGVILVATDPLVAAGVREAFRTRMIKKIYKALSFGKHTDFKYLPTLWADQYIAPGYNGCNTPLIFPEVQSQRETSPRHASKNTDKYKSPAGIRHAETMVLSAESKWLGLQHYAGAQRVPATLFTLSPQTGFTHQLRLVLQARGHPIVGDNIYGNFALQKHLHSGRPNRMFLHAQSIEAHFWAGGQQHSFAVSTESVDHNNGASFLQGWKVSLDSILLQE